MFIEPALLICFVHMKQFLLLYISRWLKPTKPVALTNQLGGKYEESNMLPIKITALLKTCKILKLVFAKSFNIEQK